MWDFSECVIVIVIVTQKEGREGSNHPREEGSPHEAGRGCSTSQGRNAATHPKEEGGQHHHTPMKEVVKAPPPEREESESHKKGGTQPYLGGAAFPCSFWALLLFSLVLGVCCFPHLFPVGCCCFPTSFFWVALLFSSLFLGCVAFTLGRCGLPSPPFWDGTGSLHLLLCLRPS